MAFSMTAAQLIFFPITLLDTTTTPPTVKPVPAGDVFSVASSKASSLGASFGVDPSPGGTLMGAIGTPLVLVSDATNAGGGITLTITDSNGDVQVVSDPISISAIAVPLHITAAAPTFSVNPTLPTAPGP